MAVSISFSVLTCALFLELLAFIPGIAVALSGVQIFPSVLKALSLSAVALVLPVILCVLTVVYGRFYCASLCPLGGLQDLALFGIRKMDRLHRLRHQRPFAILHYGILAAVFLGLVLGNVFLLNLLEPYSLFGRFTADVFRQALISLRNGLATILQAAGIYSISRAPYLPVSGWILSLAILSLAGILCLTLFLGRKFCNTLCPTGALLRLLSRFSLFRIRFVPDKCVSCGLCESGCRAGCIDGKNQKVDHSRCVLCFDCLAVCRESAIRYGLPGPLRSDNAPADKDRRNFMKTVLAGILSVPVINRALHAATTGQLSTVKKYPVLPPGSASLPVFLQRCTACHLCVTVCPNRIIRPSLFEFGLAGLFQPVLDYRLHYCGYECHACTQVCPTGAIRPMTLAEKKLTRIGLSRLEKKRCIVYDKGLECGACAEHCPNKAVHLVRWNGLGAPETDDSLCIGCGACEYACPVQPKAITVAGLEAQERAKPRKDRKLMRRKETADFPF